MATKISIFGQPEVKQEKKLKSIELVKYKDERDCICITDSIASNFKYIELRQKNYLCGGYDLILAWDKPDYVYVFLGHWNDGVV